MYKSTLKCNIRVRIAMLSVCCVREAKKKTGRAYCQSNDSLMYPQRTFSTACLENVIRGVLKRGKQRPGLYQNLKQRSLYLR